MVLQHRFRLRNLSTFAYGCMLRRANSCNVARLPITASAKQPPSPTSAPQPCDPNSTLAIIQFSKNTYRIRHLTRLWLVRVGRPPCHIHVLSAACKSKFFGMIRFACMLANLSSLPYSYLSTQSAAFEPGLNSIPTAYPINPLRNNATFVP